MRWLRSAVRVVPNPRAPNEDGRSWRYTLHITGCGLPGFRRTLAVQRDPKTLPTVGSNPWSRYYANRAMTYNRYPAELVCPLTVVQDTRYKIQEALFNVGLHMNLITSAHLRYFAINKCKATIHKTKNCTEYLK